MADEEAEIDEEALEGADPDAEGEDGGGKKKSKKKLVIILLLLLLIGGGGAGAYFSGMLGGSTGGHSDITEASEADIAAAMKKAAEKYYYPLPDFLVNLNTSSRQSSFLKMSIVLELVSEKDEKLIEANMPRINDSFNTYLRELRPSDLYGSAGLYRLREELLDRVNKIIAPAAVNDILFKNVLVQ